MVDFTAPMVVVVISFTAWVACWIHTDKKEVNMLKRKLVELLIIIAVTIALLAFLLPKILPRYDNLLIFFGLLVVASGVYAGAISIGQMKLGFWSMDCLKERLWEFGFLTIVALVCATFTLIHPWIRAAYVIFSFGVLFSCVLTLFE